MRIGLTVGVMVVCLGGLALRGRAGGEFSVAPYVDGETVAVGRVDLSKIDTGAIQKYVMGAVPGGANDQTVGAGVMMAKMAADVFLNGVKGCGVTDGYVVVSQPDAWPGRQPLAILFPVAEGKDPKALVDFLGHYAAGDLKAEVLGERVVFFGQALPLERLRNLKAVARPELALAGSGAAIEVVYAETGDVRRVIEEMMPRFPRELPGVGGMSTEWGTSGFVNATLAVELPPAPSLTLTGNFRTAGDAEACREVVRGAMGAWMGSADHADAMKGSAGGAMKKLEEVVMGELGQARSPTTAVKLRLDAGAIQELVNAVAPAADAAREQSKRVAAMNYLRQISIACIMYSQDHKNAWPGSFEDLKAYAKNDQIFVNPRDPQGGKFVLQAWTSEQAQMLSKSHVQDAPLAYEDPAGSEEGICVAFMDGHVEFFKDKGEVKKLIEKAEGEVK